MTKIKGFSSASTLALFFLFISAHAQTPQLSAVNITLEAGGVRVSAVGEVFDLMAEVVDESGETIFEGRQAGTRPLDWNLRDSRGLRVPPGTYTITVSYATQASKQRKRIEQVLITGQTGVEESASPQAQAAEEPTPSAVGTITGEGIIGRIPKFTGSTQIGNSVITEKMNRIGIGTGSPAWKLTVFGGGPTVIGGVNIESSKAPGSGVSGTGGPGVGGSNGAYQGGAGVVGKGGKGGDSTNLNFEGGYGGAGIVGTGGDGGVHTGSGSPGNGGIGVHGIGGSPKGIGVRGDGNGNGVGVVGFSSNGVGVVGQSLNEGYGVMASSSNGGTALYANHYNGNDGFAGRFRGKVEINGTTSIGSYYALNFGSGKRQMLNLWDTSYGIGVQDGTEYFRTGGGFAWYRGGIHANAANSPGSGGMRLMRLDTNGNLYTSGTVNPPSDRNLKTNFSAVNTQAILRRLASIPIQTWSYKADGDSVRHLGPVAQDFRAAFNLGVDDKTIATVDADGVIMAAVQGLYQMMRQKDRQIEQLQAQLKQVRRTIRQRRAGKR